MLDYIGLLNLNNKYKNNSVDYVGLLKLTADRQRVLTKKDLMWRLQAPYYKPVSRVKIPRNVVPKVVPVTPKLKHKSGFSIPVTTTLKYRNSKSPVYTWGSFTLRAKDLPLGIDCEVYHDDVVVYDSVFKNGIKLTDDQVRDLLKPLPHLPLVGKTKKKKLKNYAINVKQLHYMFALTDILSFGGRIWYRNDLERLSSYYSISANVDAITRVIRSSLIVNGVKPDDNMLKEMSRYL